MARIQLGNFGNVLPEVQRTPTQSVSSGQIIANAVGNVAGQFIQRKQQENAVLKQEQERDENLLYVGQTAKMNSDIEMLDRGITEQIGLNQMTYDDAISYRKENLEQIRSRYQEKIPASKKNQFDSSYDAISYDSANRLLPVAMQAKKAQDIQKVEGIVEDALKSNDKNKGAALVQSALNVSSLQADKQTEAMRNYGRRWDNNTATQRFIQLSEDGDIESLKTEYSMKSLTSNYPDMTQEDALKQYNSAQSEIGRIEKRNEVELKKREDLAKKSLDDYKSAVFAAGSRGLDESVENTTLDMVKGTPYEAEYKFYQSQSHNFTKFGQLSVTEQNRQIAKIEASLASNKSVDPETDNKILSAYKSINADKTANLDNPNQLIRNLGANVETIQPLDLLTNPTKATKSIVSNALSQMNLGESGLKLSPIPQEDVPALKDAWGKASVDQRLNIISSLISGTKNAKNGKAIWNAALGQITGNNKAYAMAGVARMNGYYAQIDGVKTDDVASAIINGENLLKDKSRTRPDPKLLDAEYDKYVGLSSTGETAALSRAAFHSLYEHLSVRDNYQHKDNKDYDKRIAKLALGLATGGVYTQTKYKGNDWKVSLPYGMKEEDFENILDVQYDRAAKVLKTTPQELKQYRLARAGLSSTGRVMYAMLYDNGRVYNYLVMPKGVTK